MSLLDTPGRATADLPSGGFLPTLVCLLSDTRNGGQPVRCRVVLDTGSERSLLSKGAAKRAKLLCFDRHKQYLKGIGGTKQGLQTSICYITLRSLVSNFTIDLMVQCIPLVASDLPGEDISPADLPDMEELQLTEPLKRPSSPIDLLIGEDYLGQILKDKLRRGPSNRLIAWESRLGTALSGQRSPAGSFALMGLTAYGPEPSELPNKELFQLLREFFSWEAVGINAKTSDILSPDEKFVLRHFYETVMKVGKHYQVRLPFKAKAEPPSNNYLAARSQFLAMERSVANKVEKRTVYNKAMNEYIEEGHVELVKSKDPSSDPVAFFLPHHPVYKQTSSTIKVRIVFNGSSEDRSGVSLNDVTLPGPPLHTQLCEVLLRFRRFDTSIAGDIAKMFLQIRIHPEDRTWLRFLWKEIGTQGPLRTWQFNSLPFGLVSSPFIAIKVIDHHLEQYQDQFPDIVRLVRESIYVDDLLLSVASPEEAARVQKIVQEMLEDGGFHITKWISNSAKALIHVPDKDRAAPQETLDLAEKNLQISPDQISQALGMVYDAVQDCFMFKGICNLANQTGKASMRQLSSACAKVYDPLGMVAPFTLIGKLLLQRCWRNKLQWDKELPEDILSPWRHWCSEAARLLDFEMPRVLIPTGSTLQLHSFSDASEAAVSAVCYVRACKPDGTIQVRFAMSKTKVCPLRPQTIPRLELLGCLIGARLAAKVAACLGIPREDVHLWTDSSTALQWLSRSPTSWACWTAHRVAECQELFEPRQWGHCPGRENIADVASRGQMVSDLLENQAWIHGPLFLYEPPDAWPRLAVPAKLSITAQLEEREEIPLSFPVLLEPQDDMFDHIFNRFRTCLLYTSPSPRDRTRSRMPSSA